MQSTSTGLTADKIRKAADLLKANEVPVPRHVPLRWKLRQRAMVKLAKIGMKRKD